MLRRILIISLTLFAISERGLSEEKKPKHEGHGGQKAIGEGKAIIKFDKQKGIQFSKEAIATMNLKLRPIEGSTFVVPNKGLVRQRENHGVYLYKKGFLKLIHVEVLKKHKKENAFSVKLKKDLRLRDQKVLLNNANLVRISEIYAQDDQEYGHSH